VEELGAGEGAPLDLAALDGTWRLCYTSASDVLVLFEAAEKLPLLQVPQPVPQFYLKFILGIPFHLVTNKAFPKKSTVTKRANANQLQMP
jgi:hypothetical protein